MSINNTNRNKIKIKCSLYIYLFILFIFIYILNVLCVRKHQELVECAEHIGVSRLCQVHQTINLGVELASAVNKLVREVLHVPQEAVVARSGPFADVVSQLPQAPGALVWAGLLALVVLGALAGGGG